MLRLMIGLLGCMMSRQVGMTVYTVDGLTRVRPHDAPRAAPSVHIKAARNEYEPFQVVVRAGEEGLQGVMVRVSDWRGARGRVISRKHVTLYREHYVEVKTPSPKSKEGAGWYPDALIPFVSPIDGKPLKGGRFVAAPFDVQPHTNQPVWVDVFVPKDAAAGDYTGTVTVTAQNQKAVTIPVKLTIWNFTLPDMPSLRSHFGGFGRRVAMAHKMDANAPEFRVVERRYAEAMAAHRLCPPIPPYLQPKVNPDGSIDPTETHAALKEWMERFHVNGFPLRLLSADPKDRERTVRHLQAMFAYLKQNGWEKFAYIYVLDEPNDADAYEQVRQRAKIIHEAQPGIKVLCTEQPTPTKPEWGTLVGSVDIWVPLWPLFEEKSGAERLAAGEELWSYTALCQGAAGKETPFWQIDFPLLNYRIPMWMSWRYGMTGLLYWTTVYWEKAGDVWTNPLTIYERFNGEGVLFYPGVDVGIDGPVASLRLKQIREGMEDYEYFKLLADAGDKEFVNQTVRRLARSWTEWETDASRLLAAREEMARRIVDQTGK
jgi:hypothetical protein